MSWKFYAVLVFMIFVFLYMTVFEIRARSKERSVKELQKKQDSLLNQTRQALQEKINITEEKSLTMDELRQMEGDIVFITPLNDWAKVMHYGLIYFGTEKNSLWQDIVGNYGTEWLAYRQEPKE